MPYINPTEEHVKGLVERGYSPDIIGDYLFDTDRNKLVRKDKAPGLTGVEQGKELLKGIGAGVMSLPAELLRLGGTTADAIRQQGFDRGFDPENPSGMTSAARAIDEKAQEWFPQDPRGWLMGGVGRAGGQIADAVLTGGLVRKGLTTAARPILSRLATPASSMIGSGLITTAGSVAERELERQLAAGEDQSSGKALRKGLTVAGVTLPVEAAAGMGAIARLLEGGAGAGAIRTGLKQAALGAGQEGAEQLAEDLIVEGKTSPEAIGQAMAIGAVAQGGTGAGIQALMNRRGGKGTVADLEAEYEANLKREVNADLAKVPQVSQPLPSPEQAFSVFTRATKTGKWDPPGATDVDTTINEAAEKKILTSPQDIVDITEMHNLGVPKDKILRTLYDRVPADVAAQLEGDMPVVDRLSDVDIQLHLDMDPGTRTPFGNPLINLLEDAKTAGPNKSPILRNIQDVRRVEMAFHGGKSKAEAISKAKAEVDRIFMERQQLSAPKRAAEAAKAIEEQRWNFFEKEFPERVKAIEGKQKAIESIEKHLGKVGLASSQFRMLSDQLAATKASLDGDTQALVAELEGKLNARPAAVPPDFQEMRRTSMPDPAALGPDPDVMPRTEGEQGSPFGGEAIAPGGINNPPVPENAGQLSEQLRLTAYSDSSKAATLLPPGSPTVDIPAGLKVLDTQHGPVAYNPDKISDLQVMQATAGDVVDSRILGMGSDGQNTQPGDTMVTTSNENATDVVSEVVRNEEEARDAIQAQQASVPGGTTEVKGAEDVIAERTRNTGIPTEVLAGLGKALGWTMENTIGLPYKMLKSANAQLATSNPSGALLTGVFPELESEHRSIANPLIGKIRPYVDDMKNPVFRRWLIDTAGTGKDGVARLPASLQPAGRAYRAALKTLHDIQRKRKIGVTDAVTGLKRDAKDDPSYAALGPDRAVREAFATFGDPRQATYRRDFMDNWRKYDTNKGWQERAMSKMDNLLSMGETSVKSNNPEFAAVREAQGIPLPPSWRAADAFDGLVDHINKASRDMAWGTVIEHNPAARAVLGLSTDPMGVDTAKTDPKSWKDAPDAWALAVREGKRTGAKWAEGVQANRPPDLPMRLNKNSEIQGNYDTILRSFNQQTINGGTPGALTSGLAAGQQLAGSLVMQLPSGIRDAATSVQLTLTKAGVWDTFKGVVDSVVAPLAQAEKARNAGGLPMDLTAAEMAETGHAVADGIYKAAKGIRHMTGRTFLDSWGRSLVYNVMNDVIASGKGMHLLEEFGPSNWQKMPLKEAASKTAAIMAERESNTSTAMNLPAFMVPQNNTPVGALFRLSNWGIGQYNHFVEDIVLPLRRGEREGFNRLMRMALGGTLLGTLVTSLTNWMADRKPEHLTWAEWVKLPDDPKKLREFFYTLTGYNQAMGTMAGVLNDTVLLPTARAMAGGDFSQYGGGELNPQMPAWIVGKQWWDAIDSFVKSPVTRVADMHDVAELGMEMLRANQMARPIARGLKAAGVEGMEEEFKFGRGKLGREERVFERLTGLSAETGKPASEPAGRKQSFSRDPFSVNNMIREARDEADWRQLEGLLEQRKIEGKPVRLPKDNRSRAMFQEIDRRRGRADAVALVQEAIREEEDIKRRNAVIKKLERKGAAR